jgi:exonuclease III
MSENHILVWNSRGLNSRARRNVVCDFIEQHRASVVCMQESKLANASISVNIELTGIDYDFAYLSAVGVAGGAYVAWRRNLWNAEHAVVRRFSITMRFLPLKRQGDPWWITNVYGPTQHAEKGNFFQELRDVHAACQGPWLVCGDFNMIYQACDKNNEKLHVGIMRSFRSLLDDLHLDELHLFGRLYTWSNHRDSPTLERLDRVFASIDWNEQYPSHYLRCLSSDASDHAPLLLVLNIEPWARPRFRFEDYWTRMDGFRDIIQVAWNTYFRASDPCKALDRKLRAIAKALRSWRATRIGSVRLRLAVARAIIYELDTAQESRALSAQEQELWRELKHSVLGLASLSRTMAWQRARTRQLAEGDACTRYFHLQACHRRRKNYLFSLQHNGQTFTEEDCKADIVFDYYNSLLGTAFTHMNRIDLLQLNLPRLDLSDQAARFTADEIVQAIRCSPTNRAPGPDGLGSSFYTAAWEIVGADIVRAFHAMWDMDFRSFHHLNEAVMVLLHKTQSPAGLRDYRPISLVHSVGKLFSKCLALRLAPRMNELIKHNQSAFIRGWRIHENFKTVQLTCRWLHARHCPTVLLKIDLAKAFDSVAWPFLLEVVEHAGFPLRWRN